MTSSAEHLSHLGILQDACTKPSTSKDGLTVDDVHNVLHKLWKETEDDDDLRALAVAFGYLMNNSKGYRSMLDDAEDGQPVSEGPFGPMFEIKNPEGNGGSASPPALRRLGKLYWWLRQSAV